MDLMCQANTDIIDTSSVAHIEYVPLGSLISRVVFDAHWH